MVDAVIKLTGTGAVVAFIIWLVLQAAIVAVDPLIQNGMFIVFAVLAIVAVVDALRGGIND